MMEIKNQGDETPGQANGSVAAIKMDLIHELGQMSIAELEKLRVEWIEESRRRGMSEFAVTYRETLCRLVIEKKLEKQIERQQATV